MFSRRPILNTIAALIPIMAEDYGIMKEAPEEYHQSIMDHIAGQI